MATNIKKGDKCFLQNKRSKNLFWIYLIFPSVNVSDINQNDDITDTMYHIKRIDKEQWKYINDAEIEKNYDIFYSGTEEYKKYMGEI